MYTKSTDGSSIMADRSFVQEVLDLNNGVYDDEASYELTKKWLKVRTQDMNFVLDTIIKNAKDGSMDEVYQHIDTGKIGLFGHSLGGAASVQLGRDRSDIDAVINLDADLLGEEVGFADGKPVINDKVYPVPMLSIYSDTMKQLMAAAVAANPDLDLPQKRISATAHDAYEVYITGTNHMSLTDLPLVSPFLVSIINGPVKKGDDGHEADAYQVIEKMNSVVLEFFNCYLKGEGSFRSTGDI
jgi:dienelactone hydrolase